MDAGNKDKTDEEKLDLKDVKAPYSVRWIKLQFPENHLNYSDLPTEEEVKKMAENVDTQRDRALLMVVWETGASPIELLGLRVKDIIFNQYGGLASFPKYTSRKTKQVNQLKTEFRYCYRTLPVASSVPDLQLWLTKLTRTPSRYGCSPFRGSSSLRYF
jgi:integrase